MTERRVRLHCEGPDDAAALREILVREWGLLRVPHQGSLPLVGDLPMQSFRSADADDGLTVEVVRQGGKDNVWARWAAWLRDQTDDTIVGIGLCFDPDEQPEEAWREELRRRGPAGLEEEKAGPDFLVPAVALPNLGREVRIVPLPWTIEVVEFDHLDAQRAPKQCLERILLGAAQVVQPERAAQAARWVCELQASADPALPRPTWKTAARLWHALAFPERGCPDVASRVFGQDRDLWTAARPLLVGGPLYSGLRRLLGDPATSQG